ncbi:putative amidase [Lachnellula subtilissima]|uniref:amidase n=1 Tax=Lachnellula subtilissima TaxID=602034 RepID=A0A8H8U6V3_9HELO|nr:putative amidase [Lachnellula subtilissima]
MDTAKLISKARETRDSSIARVEPPLAPLPDPLPKNVTRIPSQLLTARELEITALDAPELLKAIRDKVYSSEDVTRAFLRRAALAQKLTNCITELLPERAIERAKYLDSLPHPIGPFHGLPISIKEHHGMRGCSTNGGYVALVERDPDGDLPLNDVLWEAGAVFYARTTQPQAVMHLETSTGIYGVTVNPWNTDLTAGGSSGGESALVAMRGSVLGMGGDIGGSIRCPAANTGIYGFKPTPGRICSTGTIVASSGQEGVMATKGPMSTSRSGLDLFMEAEVAQTLKAAGHEIVDWIPEGHDECWNITHSLYYEDGAKCVETLLAKGGEELLPLTEWLIKDNENVKWRTAEEVCALKVKRNAYRQRYNKLWRSTASPNSPMVDAILCPTGPGAAPPHGNAKYWSYTSQWNLLEYPGVVFPVTSVDQKLDIKDEKYVPMNEQDKFNHDLYEPGRYVDAPIGLQIVTRKWEDEKCLKVLEVVEKAMGRK